MPNHPIPLVTCRGMDPGLLVRAISSINRTVFAAMQRPPEQGRFVCIVPLTDSWRLSPEVCEREGVTHFSEAIDDELLQSLRSDRGRLIFDLSNEGPIYDADRFDALHGWLAQQAIPLRQVAFVQQNRVLASQYYDARGCVGINLFNFDYFIVESYLTSLREMGSQGSQSNRDSIPADDAPAFLCLNYSPRIHRICLLLALLRDGRLDRGLVSFPGFDTEKMSFEDAWIPEIAALGRRLPDVVEMLPELRRRGRLVVDTYTEGGNALAFKLDRETHARAHAVVVTETEFYNGCVRRVTEKSIKPIFAARPFIIVGNPLSLALLRELGFQSFHPLIDESYDDAVDPALRLMLVDREITRLVSRPPEARRAFSLQVREICSFNYRLIVSGNALARYWDMYVKPLLQWLQ